MNKTLFLSLSVIEVKEKPAQLYKSILTQKMIDNNVLLAIAFFLLVKRNAYDEDIDSFCLPCDRIQKVWHTTKHL